MFRKDSFAEKSLGEVSFCFSRAFLIVAPSVLFIYIFIKDHSWCSLFNVNVKLGYKEVSRSLILRQIARFHFCSVKFAERSNFVSSLGELVFVTIKKPLEIM